MRPKPTWNPVNPFDGVGYFWDEEPPISRVEVFEDDSKGVLSENNSPDIPFRYGLNPYRGCTHACSYCYARRTHEYYNMGAGSDFETRIIVKTRAPELLKERLMKPSWQGRTIVFSGVTDCYQPLEGKWKLTRKCLEVCAEFHQPVGIITRSPLITRDIDILQELSKYRAIRVMVSIPIMDSEICKLLEPGAPSPKTRLRAVEKLHAAGIEVGVSISPIIPGLNVSSIPNALKAAKNAGAHFSFIQLLRLPGSVEQVFLHRLQEQIPHRYSKVTTALKRMRGGTLNTTSFGERMHGEGEEWAIAVRLFRLWKSKLDFKDVAALDQPSPFRRPGSATQLRLFE